MKHATIYELLGEYKKEDVDKVIASLTDEERKVISLRYKSFKKEAVWTEENRYYFYRILVPKIRRILNNIVRRPKLIYAYFPNNSEKEINEAIKHLKDEYKKILFLRYGNDLKNPDILSKEWNSDYMHIFHNFILKDIQKFLSYKTTARKIKSIYKILGEYSKEEIDEAIKRLSPEDKEVLRKRYGDNLEIPNTTSEWNETYYVAFYRGVIPKIRKIIRENANSIYSYFPDYTVEQVDKAIELLDNKTKAELVICYNYDVNKANNVALNGVNLTLNTKKTARMKVFSRIKTLYGGHKIKTIYEYFPEYSKEEVDRAILLLNQKDRELLYFKYNGNLDKPIRNLEWSSKYSSKFVRIVDRLTNILNGRKTVHTSVIYDYFPNVKEEVINGILVSLPFSDKELIYLRYGSDLKNPVKNEIWNSSFLNRFESLVCRIRRKLEKNEEIEAVISFEGDSDYQEIIKDYKSKKYDNKEYSEKKGAFEFGLDVQQTLIDLLDDLEYKVVSLRYIENFTIEDIAYILIVDEKEVINILKKAMYLYKRERLNSLIEEEKEISLKRARESK